jgi:membrane-bound metal-dependent hydrolase YbcI (DUF457 family)
VFLGHIAVGLAGKRFAPRSSLGTLLFAPLFLDLLWPVFLLLGWEQVRARPGPTPFLGLDFVSYPWSHSLHMTVFWAGLVGIVFRTVNRDTRGAVWMSLAVLSHWVLDWITHAPDLPIWPGGPRVGLGLWNSVPWTLGTELAMFTAGLWLYLRATRPRGGRGRLSLWSFVAVSGLLYFTSLLPTPATIGQRTIALMSLVLWLFIPWAWWIDSTRRTVRSIGRRMRQAA